MQFGTNLQKTTKPSRRREEIESINRICEPRLRWLCHLINEEKDRRTFDSLIEALEELLAIRRNALRQAVLNGAHAPKYPIAA